VTTIISRAGSANSPAARDVAALMPVTLHMQALVGREKPA